MNSKLIREKFLQFFQEKSHQIVPSAPIVLKDDPTLMFTNSGMNQFKNYFLGYDTPTHLRIADTQKCLRVSGKHNDLDDVGRDTYHHTMFEMLGNWSFGDYFKKEAIAWAWELLTEVYKIPKENLYVTIFEGDEKENIPKDEEAYQYWKAFISEERILLGNKKDNFWEMGASGPCGPCSEIHIDLRSEEEKQKVSGKELVNNDHPQVVEVWNLVFMQYLRKADGNLEVLPVKSIDTGMGFERLCMALQGKESNYDTDVFTPLIEKLEQISGKKYGQKEETDMAIRVVVDHLRAVSFAIADGQLPSSTSSGYVIRRILRRAISYGYRFLGQNTPFIYKLLPVLKEQLKDFFPELEKQETLVESVIREEEASFLKTIEKGLFRLDQIMSEDEVKTSGIISGAKVFELYDTYGFPSDLSRIIAEEKNLKIDEEAFDEEMAKQKQRSKGAAENFTEDWVILKETNEVFLGYDQTQSQCFVTRYRKTTGKKGSFFQLVLDKTPFYPEGGGQVGDTGILDFKGEKIEVLDTKKENNLLIHITSVLPKDPSIECLAQINLEKRANTEKNHSATHLLHQALREVLGTHVEQKGSFVGPDYLRFDFSHFAKLSVEELEKVESLVNQRIQAGFALEENRKASLEEAISMGAMALFGEKYGSEVRTIKFGDSIELCGGTHTQNTSKIGLFKITSESSTATGIRRIEAITSSKVIELYKQGEETLKKVASALKNPKDLAGSIENLLLENSSLKKQLESLKEEKAIALAQTWKEKMQNVGGKNLLLVQTKMEAHLVKAAAISLQKEISDLCLVVGSVFEGKPSLSVSVAQSFVDKNQYHAGNIIKELAKEISGGGGGQAAFAAAGGTNIVGISGALEKAKEIFS
ncbi:MAG: alanine--tRNA ligase [Flavobacteriaceae bacterium]|nr:MAG: alanine--tRNA ligase [Flavobacteriaceae bacterium]